MTTKLIRKGLTYGVTLGLTVALLGCGGGGQAAKEPPPPTLQQQVRKAQSMLRAGRVTEAMDIMQGELAKTPDNARLQSEYGKFCFQAARYDEAETAFLRALSLDPFMTDARNFLGAVYAQTGRPAEAEAAYRAALNDPAYPTPEMIYLNLGLLYAGQGRDEEAINALRLALELNPKYYKAHYELASLLDRNGQLREAAREYEVASPDYLQAAEYHYRLGWVYFRLDDKEKARKSLQRAISLGPGSYSAAKSDELLQMMD